MFCNTGSHPVDYLTELKDSEYDLGLLLTICDDPNITLCHDNSKESIIDHVCFFLRTFEGNLVVCNPKDNKVVFKSLVGKHIPEGTTINDFMLFTAKQLLTNILYPRALGDKIAFNVFPTPFGVIKRADGTSEAMFQLVVKHDVLSELCKPYEYLSVDRFKDNPQFHKVYKQFKYTRI